ncbi:MAG TPA: hypothetical protein VKZ45_06905 [Vicingaceae bacterium]|jgi:hypothetical protein|nr:hypothetical protein [Vicingaceae bacterium]
MKKLFLAVALISFVGLSNVEAAPCEGGKCDKKECTSKKGDKKSCHDKKTADAKSCSSKDAKKSCCASKAKASTENKDKVEKTEKKTAE